MLRHTKLAVALLAFAVVAGSSPHRLSAQAPTQEPQSAVYIVQMDDEPVLTFTGNGGGRRATKPAEGEKIDPDDANVAAYARYLTQRHDTAAARVGSRRLYSYRYAFNGFAVRLTEPQAAALKSMPGVLRVTKDELRHSTTSDTPRFLELDEPGGLWDQLAGPERAGEDIIIGVVDSGVWPESLSFTDRVNNQGVPSATGRLAYHRVRGWHGRCESGEEFTAADCNNKLIGAQRFNAAWGGDAGIAAQRPWEFTSPRDYNGHGTHTASTAGGNHNTPTTGEAMVFGPVSGMAPRARIAVYKALWSTEDGSQASGFTSDLVAAIDKAVADGVDVINYSVSGTSTNFADPAELAFLNAAASGIFVAASAGNDGPGNFTVAHPSPWVTTVAAGTHNRSGEGAVTANSTTYMGASFANATGPKPLIDSINAGLPGADPTALALCFTAADNGGTPVLDPAKVAGKIVICDRGVNARVNKSLAVRDAGGAGMILLNPSVQSVNADFHFVPTVHLQFDAAGRAALKAYAATPGATASIAKATIVYNVAAPLTASFSSRGPLLAGNGDILKPDVIAPGQDILAAVAPPANAGRSFNMYSGTSMSAPHVAGLAALLKQRHPRWSPMMIKSALMTTGTDVIDTPASTVARIFRQGGGHVSPTNAADPGLVFDSNIVDWGAFLCGTTTEVRPVICKVLKLIGASFDPSDLNLASIAIGDLAGKQTVKRRVTNVGGSTATYSHAVTGLAGITVKVSPATLRLRPGETKSFTVTFTRTTSTFNTYNGGHITWSDGNHDVRMPVVIAPVALAAPAEVTSTGGPIRYSVKFGYTGPFSATARGLVPATTTDGSVADDPNDAFDPDGPGVASFPVVIAPGTTYARFSLFDANVSPASDLDLYVFQGTTLVAASGTGTSEEEANLVNPAPGNYTVFVHGFSVPGTANFTLFQWLLDSTAAGNMTVTAPTTATTGATGTVNVSFSGLTPGTKYLGSVAYSGSASLPAPTVVRVDP